MYQQQRSGGGFRIPPTLIIAAVMAGFSLCRYYSTRTTNDITNEVQYISMDPQQEIAMGLESAPQMAQEFGGVVRQEEPVAQLVKQVGQSLVANTVAAQTPYKNDFNFHLLADERTINAFALPGGQIFITLALLSRLTDDHGRVSPSQLAGVLGHEIGHVVARHSAEKLAQMELAQGLTGAVGVATGGAGGAHAAQTVANMMQLSYGREQELQSDELGVRLMLEAGYEPMDLIKVMEVLKQAAGPNRVPEHQSSHPDPENKERKKFLKPSKSTAADKLRKNPKGD